MSPQVEQEESAIASVQIFEWGNALAAQAFVQLGMGLRPPDSRELANAALPISLLCSVTQAAAMAALITELGGRVAVSLETSPAIRMLARLAER